MKDTWHHFIRAPLFSHSFLSGTDASLPVFLSVKWLHLKCPSGHSSYCSVWTEHSGLPLKDLFILFSYVWMFMTKFVPSALRGWKMAPHHMKLELQMVMNDSVGAMTASSALSWFAISPAHQSSPDSSPKSHSQYLVCLFSFLQFIKKMNIFRELRVSLGVNGSLVCIWVNIAGLLSIRFGVSGHLYSVLKDEEAEHVCSLGVVCFSCRGPFNPCFLFSFLLLLSIHTPPRPWLCTSSTHVIY